MISDVDDSLAALLAAELAQSGDGSWPAVAVSFASNPEGTSGDPAPRVNLCLHDVRENVQLRDESFHVSRKPGGDSIDRRRAPLKLDISYLVTAHIQGEAGTSEEHRLLADVLGILLRHPVLPDGHLKGRLAEPGVGPVRLTVGVADQPAHRDIPALWRALGGRLVPSLALVATAPFDPFAPQTIKVVREAVIGVGEGVGPDGARRPIDVGGVRVSTAGIVVDALTGKPLPEISIGVVGRPDSVRTDENGFFHLLNLPPGKAVLKAQARGWEPAEEEVQCPAPGRPDQFRLVSISLKPLSRPTRAAAEAELAQAAADARGLTETNRTVRMTLSGRITWPDGRPAAYLPVRTAQQATITDRQGVYSFHDLPPGEHEVIVDMPGVGALPIPENGIVSIPHAPQDESGTRGSTPKKEHRSREGTAEAGKPGR